MGFARSDASILGNIELSELVAESEDRCVDRRSARLASVQPRCARWQRGLGTDCAPRRSSTRREFMRDRSRRYRDLWRRACAAGDRAIAPSASAARVGPGRAHAHGESGEEDMMAESTVP
jgi:hypothetical protein